MLVLTRRFGQKILIGDSVVVTVVRISAEEVRIGIDAPPEMVILREEVKPEKPGGVSTDEAKKNGAPF